jgi:hypothetical protein
VELGRVEAQAFRPSVFLPCKGVLAARQSPSVVGTPFLPVRPQLTLTISPAREARLREQARQAGLTLDE